MTTLNLDNIDLGSFGPTGDQSSDVETVVRDQQTRQLNATLGEAIKVNPDQHAHINKLSRESGIPVDAVETDVQSVETDLKLNQIDLRGMTRTNPTTSKFLSDFDRAAVSHDDIEALKSLENTVKNQNSYFGNVARGVAERATELTGSLYAFASQTGAALDDKMSLGGFVFEDSLLPRYVAPDEWERLQETGMEDLVARTGGILKATDFGYVPQATWEDTKEAYASGDVLDAAGATLAFGFEQGTHSLADMVATVYALPTYIAARAQEIGEARAENKGLEEATIQETLEAAPFAVGSALLERILPSKIFQGMPDKEIAQTGRDILEVSSDRLKEVLKDTGSGLITEASTEAVQEGIIEYIAEKYGTDASMSLAEVFDRGLAGAVGGGVTGGIFGGTASATNITINTNAQRKADAALRKLATDSAQSTAEQNTIDSLNEQAQASKLRERDPEAFHQFIEQSDGDNNTNVFIDAVQAKLYLADKNVETDPALQLLSDRINEAAVLGGEVTIPVADFATTIAGTEHFDNLRNFMTLSGETTAPFRQEQVQQETRDYVTTLLEEAQENATQFVESQEIFESVRSQLVDTGMVNEQNAGVMAQIVPAWATVYAQKNGITVAEAYERSGLVIEGPQTGVAESLQTEQVRPPIIPEEQIQERIVDRESVPDRRTPSAIAVETEQRGEDRRQDTARRNRIADMTPEEQYRAIYTNELTGLNNRRAFEEDLVDSPIVASIDVDSLKTVNDNLGHDSGDQLLKVAGKAIHEATGGKAYHISGDEFYVLGDNQAEIESNLEAARQALSSSVVASDKGQLTGVDFTYGFGDTKEAADSAMEQAKTDRESAGERASRGELPTGLQLSEQFQQTIDQTETEEFREWAGTSDPVIEPDEINETDFSGEGPFVMRAYHGTTHSFEEFDASLRGNLEGHFGAVNYFTSSEYDADRNYTSEGPDLTIRIEQRAEELASKLDDMAEETPDVAERMVSELGLVVRDVTDHDLVAKAIAERELSGESEQVMELFVRTEKPLVVGTDDSPFIEFVDFEAIEQEAIEQVADNNGVEVSEVQENRDDYKDEIDEARWEIEADTENELMSAIETVANRYDGMDAAELYGAVSELALEGTTSSELEQLLREQEQLSYAEDRDTGALAGFHALAEIIQELGFDSIILKNANERFSNMDMVDGTAHIHIFDANNTNIKSVENQGTFDRQDPNIFKQRERGYYEPSRSLIRLTEAADLSTFLHEFAHFMYEMELQTNSDTIQSINNWYKRNSKDVVKEAQSYLEDFTGNISEQDVITFLDVGTVGQKSKDSAIRRAVHEQFARGFETYLMEGKAPSVELRNAFRTFARWLTQIYKAVRGQLNVKLDDQMRQVFDRLLATEEQIAAAEARAQYSPMFNDATMSGMTEQEFEKYKAQQQRMKDKETESLRDKLIKEITRTTKAQWKEEKQDIIDEQLVDLRNEPVYRAIEGLRSGEVKLDHATVKEMVGFERTDKRGRTSTRVPDQLRNMTAKGAKGVHPDEAAAFYGFGSGAEMLDTIINAEPIGDKAANNAETIMLERHGDLMNDGTIQQQADEALQNEERGKLILQELKALRKGTNAPALDRATIKEMAEENIAKLSYRQIFPQKYRKAEIRAAQEAAVALAAGDKEAAAQAKARQVLNYYLGMAATNARNETLKIVDRMSRYNKKRVREEIQKVENGYWEQINKILGRFEFRKSATLRQVDEVNQDINTWMKERMEIDGDALVLSPVVLNETYVTHWKNVPHGELQGVNDSVKNIEHVARYSNRMTRMGEEMDFRKLVDRWVNHMNDVQPNRFQPQRTDVVQGRNWGRWAMAQMTKIPYMASWLDGGERVGLSHDILMQPFTDAADAEIKLWEDVGNIVLESIEGRSKEDIKRHNRKVYISEIKDENNDGNLMGHQILAVALNTGNQGNLRKMLLGEGWAQPDNDAQITLQNPKLQAVLKHMTKSDWDLVQLIWDQMDKLYPQLAEVHRRTTGLVPPKVDAAPVETPFGTFKGGYYPVKYDANRDHRAELNEDKLNAQTESMFSTIGSIQASVNASATNERTKYYAPIRLSLDVVPGHFQETIHYITHHDAVREVNKLIRNKSVAETIKAKLGPEEFAQLKPWLNDLAKDGKEAPTKMFWDDMLGRLRFGLTLGTMGFRVTTGLIQLSGMSNTIAEVGLKPVLQSARSILGSPSTMREAWDFANSNSKVLNHRTKTMDREIKNAMTKLAGKRGMLAAVQEASMKHIAYIQTFMVDLPSWYAAYIQKLDETGDVQKAYQYADWVVENVQGSGMTKDMARIMRGQSESGRMFTMFMTFFSSLWNLERDVVKGARSGRYSVTSVAAKLMFLFSIPVLFEMLLRGEFDEDDEPEEALQQILTKTASFPVQSVPFVRDIVNGATGEFGYNISPIASVLEAGTRSVPELATRPFADEEITKSQAKGASKVVGAAFGIPGVNQTWATGEHLYEVLEDGEDFTVREFLFGPERDK